MIWPNQVRGKYIHHSVAVNNNQKYYGMTLSRVIELNRNHLVFTMILATDVNYNPWCRSQLSNEISFVTCKSTLGCKHKLKTEKNYVDHNLLIACF